MLRYAYYIKNITAREYDFLYFKLIDFLSYQKNEIY